MSFEVMAWAVDQDLPTYPKMTLLMLANRINKDTGQCNPSLRRLAADCGMTTRKARSCLRDLEERGYIVCEPVHDDGQQRANTYSIRLPERPPGPGQSPPNDPDNPPEQHAGGAEQYSGGGGTMFPRGRNSVPPKNQEVEPVSEPTIRRDLSARPFETNQEYKYGKHKFTGWDYSTAEFMWAFIQEIAPRATPPNLVKWADVIRRMRTIDCLSGEEILTVFRWANTHEFWRVNILSPDKLRKQYARLEAEIRNRGGGPAQDPQARMTDRSWAEDHSGPSGGNNHGDHD